ncbi:hypothetical protein F1C16_05090 [Hymenobacter sp. NBH84]|uniref:hypothetical protein n=1 Tax=Hymenobacter sp. NBH84 TaxID=2596915 RepID=UPI001628C122|nr:hypothetical protein [Hymenobacter sp. NBH84]QNE38971.1 hypothetical protein F1C16_05090 [Hymenobacter sp. NBH84]
MQELIKIELTDGSLTESAKLKDYFTTIFEAEKSGEKFPVNLDDVWPIGYGRKNTAVKALKKKFIEGVDYQSVIQLVQREVGASKEIVYLLSVSCAEYFSVRANREVFEIYSQCRKAVQNVVAAKPQSQLDILAGAIQALQHQEQRMVAVETDVADVQQEVKQLLHTYENNVTPQDYYTVSYYCRKNNKSLTPSDSQRLGKLASALSKDSEFPKRSVPDAKYGQVGIYHVSILKMVTGF